MPDPMRVPVDEGLRRIAATGDPISQMHRDITGHAVRLHVPLKDAVQIRDAAKALRVLASTLESLSHSKDDEWRVLFMARAAVQMCNRVIGGRRGR